MLNVHERPINAPVEVVGALLDRLASADDPLWPTPAWPPLHFDRPLAVGATGGHGPIKYSVEAYEPGRRVRCRFDPSLADGHHELTVEAREDGRCVMRHVISARMRGVMLLLWPLSIRWLHDALIEDLLDNAELAATGRLRKPAAWPAVVRWQHRLSWPKATFSPLPERATLARAAMEHPDLVDSWKIPVWSGMPADPGTWAAAIFHRPPGWVSALMRLRNRLAGLIGIERGDQHSFDPIARTDSEHLLGTDAGHLDFRASILVEPHAVILTTVARTHNRRGRVYLAIIRVVHPAIARGMLRDASRRLARTAPRRVIDGHC
jgi:hypothetical protein